MFAVAGSSKSSLARRKQTQPERKKRSQPALRPTTGRAVYRECECRVTLREKR